jgi:hypothetical protein
LEVVKRWLVHSASSTRTSNAEIMALKALRFRRHTFNGQQFCVNILSFAQ